MRGKQVERMKKKKHKKKTKNAYFSHFPSSLSSYFFFSCSPFFLLIKSPLLFYFLPFPPVLLPLRLSFLSPFFLLPVFLSLLPIPLFPLLPIPLFPLLLLTFLVSPVYLFSSSFYSFCSSPLQFLTSPNSTSVQVIRPEASPTGVNICVSSRRSIR